jgi:HEAT repeat protein
MGISWVTAKDEKDRRARLRAVQRLRRLGGSAALDVLINSLQHWDREVQRAAATALGHIKNHRSLEPLISCLAGSLQDVVVVDALDSVDDQWPGSASGRQALSILHEQLKTDENYYRMLATIELLKRVGDQSSIPVLAPFSIEESEELREAAKRALEHIDPHWLDNPAVQGAIGDFVRQLGSCWKKVQDGALKALKHIDRNWHLHPAARAAVPNLIESIHTRPHYYHINAKRTAEALASIAAGCPESKTATEIMKAFATVLSKDHEAEARQHAAELLTRLGWTETDSDNAASYHFVHRHWDRLAQMGGPAAKYLVKMMANGDPQTRKAAVEGLVAFGIQGTEPLLSLVKTTDSREARRAAVEVLDLINPRWRESEAVSQLKSKLRERLASADSDVRDRAAAALGEIGDRELIPELVEGLDTEDPDYLRGCVTALGYLADDAAVVPLLKTLKHGRGDQYSILSALSQIGTPTAQSELEKIVQRGGRIAEEACQFLNGFRPSEKQHLVCPNCHAYLGVRKELRARGSTITDRMREEAEKRRVMIIGNAFYTCKVCHSDVIIS